ncbi:tetratricopeptide repeat-containing sulfotransferase family protein [Roseibium aggregatum]|uniref:Tetratricopeptide repeat protein n=1 Tax=Roseibium aggregatum TaxID=187304 RepID=A0A926S584_9HYPH|nr:sulfotransferase [Roseibium aggregatum]MBD1547193.1 tetratricopeptide repeat protein [Roseibium aggregatum]
MNDTQYDQALRLVTEERYKEAAPLLQGLHTAFPQDARINFSLGIVYDHFGELRPALTHLLAASKVATKRSEVFCKLAEVQNNLNDYEGALKSARHAVALENSSELAHIYLGNSYYYLQKPEMARQSYIRAVDIAPNSPFGHISLYRLEVSLGNFEEAKKHLAKAYELEPNNPLVLMGAAETAEFRKKPEVLQNILKIIDDPDTLVAPDTLANLSLAAGNICEKNSDLEQAFANYAKHRDGMYRDFNLAPRKWQLDAMKGLFSKEFFAHRKGFGLETDRPVFVVGMPRSGTTLVEQIIGRHPQATGVGEQHFFTELQKQMQQGQGISPMFFEAAISLDEKHAKRVARKYLAELDKYDKRALRIVDKMPHNFEMLWMIALVFPNAKVVHVHREPADNCCSIYKSPLSPFHSYNFDQESLGAYYGLYADLMEHWKEVLPINIHQLSYEAMIADQEAETRALLDYVELPWDPVCLDFQSGDRQVLTLSSQQVRQPIYSSSIGQWRKYEPYIQPLLKALGKYAPKQ